MVAPVLALLLACGARDAASDPGLYLNWNDCSLGAGATSEVVSACSAVTAGSLVVSFELAAPVDSVIGLLATVDVQTDAATLPDWWAYAPGGCHYGSLVASAEFPGLGACTDFWQGAATFGGPPVYYVGAPRGGAGQARIVASFAVLSTATRSLSAGVRYYAARLTLPTGGTADCQGCAVAACMVLNSIELQRVSGGPGGTVSVDTPGGVRANWATWQGSGANCSAVPVRRRTWGELKSLYR